MIYYFPKLVIKPNAVGNRGDVTPLKTQFFLATEVLGYNHSLIAQNVQIVATQLPEEKRNDETMTGKKR